MKIFKGSKAILTAKLHEGLHVELIFFIVVLLEKFYMQIITEGPIIPALSPVIVRSLGAI